MRRILLLALVFSTLQATAYENRLDFGLKTTAYNYVERLSDGTFFDSEKSNLFDINGLYLGYDKRIHAFDSSTQDVAYYFNIVGSYTAGDTEYDGGVGGPLHTTKNTFADIQVNLKRTQDFGSNTLYGSLGLGYKYWERELEKYYTSSLSEKYSWYYLQAMIGAKTNIYNQNTLGLELTYQYALNPEIYIDNNDDISKYSFNETLNLGTTYSLKAAVPMVLPITESLKFNSKVEYEYTKINPSEKRNYVLAGKPVTDQEPESKQNNWHLYIGLLYDF